MKGQLWRRFFFYFWKNLREIAIAILTISLLLFLVTAPGVVVGFLTYLILAPRTGQDGATTAAMVVTVVVVAITCLAVFSYAQAAEE